MKNSVEKIVRVEGKETEEFKEKHYGSGQITRRERLAYLCKQLNEARNEFHTANTEKSVNMALDRMTGIIKELASDSQVFEVGHIGGIMCGIRNLKLYNVTRSSLDDLIQNLLERVKEIIEE